MGGVYAQRSDTLIHFVVFWAGETFIKMFLVNLRKGTESMSSISEWGVSQWHGQKHFTSASE